MCFGCWSGDSCDQQLEDSQCVISAAGGTPFIFEDYWVDHPEAAITIKASDHIGYDHQHPRLEAAIRALHEMMGNAVTAGKHIVVGVGSTELISAALFALAEDAEPAQVWAAPPFYSGYTRTRASLTSGPPGGAGPTAPPGLPKGPARRCWGSPTAPPARDSS